MDFLDLMVDPSPFAVLLKALIGALIFCLVGTLVIFCCVFSRKTSLKSDVEVESQPVASAVHLEMVETDFYGHVIEELQWKIGNRKKVYWI